MLQQDKEQYERESQCQDYVDYGPQGYHPVILGQKFNQKYVVIQKLGWGHFSTVWLVHNETTNQYGALKVQRSKQSHAESALDELQILSQIRKHESDPNWLDFLRNLENQHPQLIKSSLCRPLLLLDNFPHYGIHGKHYCSVFQILGPNLLDVIQHYEFEEKQMPLWLVKKITIDVLLGLVYLHQYSNIIHTDLKPENIMIKLQPYEEAQLIEQIKAYKIKPISMKFLKNLQTSKNSKNKKKKLKKKKKKQQQLKCDNNQNEQQETPQSQISQSENTPGNEEQSSNLNVQSSQIKKQIDRQLQQKEPISKKQNGLPQLVEHSQKVVSPTDQEWNPLVLKWKNVKIQLNNKIFFKIVDMGNACFTNKHFTEGIQTRQYRAPEVILGQGYEPNTDVWSLACTVFELMTNNFLFKPKIIEGISKDQDHLFKMMEVLGPMSKQFATTGTQSAQYFNKKGKLIHGNPKKQLSISQLLIQDYQYDPVIAKEAQQFLLPMLAYEPSKRISAKDCLKHPWLWK